MEICEEDVVSNLEEGGACYALDVEDVFDDSICLKVVRLVHTILDSCPESHAGEKISWRWLGDRLLGGVISDLDLDEVCCAFNEAATPEESSWEYHRHIFELHGLLKPIFDGLKRSPDEYEQRLKQKQRVKSRTYSVPDIVNDYLIKKSAEMFLNSGQRMSSSSLLTMIVKAEIDRNPVKKITSRIGQESEDH